MRPLVRRLAWGSHGLSRLQTCLPIHFVPMPSFKRAVKAKESNQGIYYRELGYILKTGANWAKPIADFTLTIEKTQRSACFFLLERSGRSEKSTAK